MTSINKQKFLAELGKLLTFMYEEDRQRAIGMYSRMFEEAGDEQMLIQSLISPTRQAVVVARAYNSNLGRLSLTSESKAAPEDRDENGVPDYVQAIEAVREQAWAAQGMTAKPESEEETVEEDLQGEEKESEEVSAEAEAEEPSVPETENAAEPDEPDGAEPEENAEETAAEQETEQEKTEETPEEAETEEPSEPEQDSPAETVAPAEEETDRDDVAEQEAISTVTEQEEAPVPEESPAEDRSEKPEGIEFFTLPEAGKETPESDTLLDENGFNVDSEALRKPRRKPKVFALIVYILLAIPLTICAIAVLLIPAILFLALSIATIICGVVLVSTAFKGFAVFADIMVVLGVSLVLFALGLLFLWTAIWFIGGAIVGVVHGVAVLCEKWCYKEVLEA